MRIASVKKNAPGGSVLQRRHKPNITTRIEAVRTTFIRVFGPLHELIASRARQASAPIEEGPDFS